MKTILANVLVTVCLSCTKNDNDAGQGLFELQNSPQRWELYAITSSWANEVTTGNDLDWKEFYILNADKTFLKSREIDGNIVEASGTFEIVSSPEGQDLELIFETGNGRRASCFPEKEFLSYRRNPLLNRSWTHCDGPSMSYRLAKD